MCKAQFKRRISVASNGSNNGFCSFALNCLLLHIKKKTQISTYITLASTEIVLGVEASSYPRSSLAR